jgi:hypothetical protein
MDAVIGKLLSPDVGTRNGAAIALQEMVELGKVNDPVSKGKVKQAFNRLRCSPAFVKSYVRKRADITHGRRLPT